ncbi:MAG TPA: exonuclease domain-containing protein [Desulfobacterales bacterium]|nr:exonuclease domain-containing protein [Desulfobacterales bacterium]
MPRLRKHYGFWLFVLVCILFTIGVVGCFAVLFWLDLTPAESAILKSLIHPHGIYFVGAALLLIAGAGLAIEWVFRLYVFPIGKIADETGIMHGVNPGHRIRVEGSRDIKQLTAAINFSAEAFETLNRSVGERIADARARIEEEKNILSVALAELPEGVLVCSPEGRIILYNERARQLLESSGETATGLQRAQPDGSVGLGRSIFSAIDKPLITSALDEIAAHLRRGGRELASSFVIAGRSGRLLQVETVYILGPLREMTAFALILTDATEQMEAFRRAESLLQSYTIRVRRALASIRSSVELILDFPELPPAKSHEFHRIIRCEALAAGEATDRVMVEYAASTRPPGPLARMRAQDFLDAVRRKAGDRLGLDLQMGPVQDALWIRLDNTSMALALVFILERLGAEFGHTVLRCRLEAKDRFVGIDFVWPGTPLRLETLHCWELQPVSVADEGLRFTLKEILTRHRAELYSQSLGNGSESYLRLLLELAEPADAVQPRWKTVLATARPVYYDFDLFNQPGQSFELDRRQLAGLPYTVFDTETTGLNPREGDEIVALGAVRIVNGRLIASECYEQLVKPGTALRPESIRIHGIQPEMLEGQPDVRQVLRSFQRFAEGTILVAHNAAFDMRLLQLQGEGAGIRFENPVLDTMLLSAVVHSALDEHNIEAIAGRLGITIKGRHTALGDATATAEIFLKLMPLLKAAGIDTLKQAREASQKTFYARMKY